MPVESFQRITGVSHKNPIRCQLWLVRTCDGEYPFHSNSRNYKVAGSVQDFYRNKAQHFAEPSKRKMEKELLFLGGKRQPVEVSDFLKELKVKPIGFFFFEFGT